jgi:two-component system sensor histidine kinase QseC
VKSIRARLVVGIVAGFGLLLAGGGALLYFSVRAALLREFDAALHARAQALATLTTRSGNKFELEFAEEVMPEFEGGPHPAYFQLWQPGGKLLERSPSLRQADLPRPVAHAGSLNFWDLPLPNGRSGRAVGLSFQPQVEDGDTLALEASKSSPPAVVVVAVERNQLDHQLRLIAGATAIVALAMMSGAAVLAFLIIRGALKPLANLAENVSGIDAGTLDSRFPADRVPSELKPICQRLNELLSRLESAFQRERRFSANVAHELRTPVAELRSLAEVAVKWPTGDAETQRAFIDTLEIAQQMEGIVSGLLVIARCESGIEHIQREPIMLEAFVREAWRPFATQAARKELAVHLDLPESAVVESDRALLRIILVNFFSNAVEYSPTRGKLSITAAPVNSAIELQIANTATDIVQSDLPHVFDRFWRKATARTSSHRAGLGLSISQSVAQILGLTFRAEIPQAEMFVISLVLPVARSLPSGSVTRTSRCTD